MGLAPLLRFSVEKLEAEDTLSELIHNGGPQHDVNLVILPSKQGVNVRKLAQIEAASISAAFLKRSGNRAEFAVPGFTGLIARLILLSSDWVSEGWSGTILISVDQFSSTMSKQLVASNMDLV